MLIPFLFYPITNKSEIHKLDVPGYISKHKMVKEKKYIAYELVANILLVNEELDLVDIIGNDQRLRDGIMKKQLETGIHP